MFKRFSNWYDSLYAVVGVVPSPWRSKIFVPVLARQTWALVSKFLAIKPTFQVKVAKPEYSDEDIDAKAEKARRKLEYDYENPYMDESMRDKLFSPLLDAVVTGTGLAKVCWSTDTDTRYERIPQADGTVDLTKEKKISKTVGYNDIEPVNIFNVYVSPSATNLYDAPWIIIKEWKTIAELKEVNDAKGVQIYKNLDQLNGNTSYDDEDNTFNLSRNRLLNQNDRVDKTIKMVKIFECYEGDTICTYAESGSNSSDDSDNSAWVLLREQKNPYWHGKYPLVKFHVKNRPFQFWGEGIFETTYRIQTAYNDVFNHYMDQWNLAENSMLMTSERSNVNDYVVEPGGVITYRGDVPPTQFKHADPNPNQLNAILMYMDQAIEGVTISQYAAGLPNSATDKTRGTAHGIADLQQAAGDIVSFMRTNFTQTVTQIGRMWLSNNQQFMQEPVTLNVNVSGQKQSVDVTPQDMQGDMELMVDEASMDPATLKDRQAAFMAYIQQLQQLEQQSLQQAQSTRWAIKPIYINYGSLVQDYSEIMGHPNYEKLLLPGDQVEQAIQSSQTPMVMPNERFMMNPATDFLPSEIAQLLQRNGIQPDPSREQGAQTPAELVALGDAAASQAKAQQTSQQGQLTPDHILKADQQTHKQQMDVAKLGLDAHKQVGDQQVQQQQMEQQAAQTVNPADHSAHALAQELAQQGHVDPAVLAHFQQPQQKPGLLQRMGLKGSSNAR